MPRRTPRNSRSLCKSRIHLLSEGQPWCGCTPHHSTAPPKRLSGDRLKKLHLHSLNARWFDALSNSNVPRLTASTLSRGFSSEMQTSLSNANSTSGREVHSAAFDTAPGGGLRPSSLSLRPQFARGFIRASAAKRLWCCSSSSVSRSFFCVSSNCAARVSWCCFSALAAAATRLRASACASFCCCSCKYTRTQRVPPSRVPHNPT